MREFTISGLEYATLLERNTLLSLVRKVIDEHDAYDGYRILKAILNDDKKEEEE